MNLHKFILNSLNQGVVYADNDHIIRYMDLEAQEHFKKSGGKNLVGTNLFDYHREESKKKIEEYHKQMFEGKLEEIMVRKSDKLNLFMKAVRDDEGQLIGYMEYFRKAEQTTTPPKENLYQLSYMLYDEIHSHDKRNMDIEFFKNVIPYEASVLEIGCGTGRVSMGLATRGNQVVGIDLSREMLNIFNQKIVQNLELIKGTVKTHLMDMTYFELHKKFDYIIFPFGVFQFLLTDKFRRSCLECVKRHLNKGGQVIIDMFNPIPESFEGWENKKTFEMKFNSDTLNASVNKVHIGDKHFEKQQIISYKNLYIVEKENGQVQTIEEPMRLAYHYEEQAKKIFEDHGFKITHRYGNWDFTDISMEQRKELIYILQLTTE